MKKFKKILSSFSFLLFIILIILPPLWAQDKEKDKTDSTAKKITRLKVGDAGIILETDEGVEGVEIIAPDTEEISPKQINIRIPSQPKHSTVIHIDQGGIVKFWEDITIEEDEKVSGDVVAIGGAVRVNGLVKGEVVAIGGDVYVSSTGIVTEDAVSVGGQVIREPGAVIKGESVGVTFLPRHLIPRHIAIGLPGPFHHGLSFILTIFKVLFLFFLGIIVLALVPKNVQKMKDKIIQNVWKSGFIGISGEILVFPVFIILLITIIGIPVALLILPLFIILGALLGYISVSILIGEKLKQSTNLKPQTQMMTLALGILAVESASLLSGFLKVFWGFFSILSVIFTIIGFMITFLVVTIGFGGAIQTLLGTRPKDIPVPVTPESSQSRTQT